MCQSGLDVSPGRDDGRVQQPESGRSRTRRHERLRHKIEPIPPDVSGAPPEADDRATVAARTLNDAGSLLSTLRAAHVDVRMARLALVFPTARHPLDAADVAWRMGLTPSGATRLLDRAEQRGFVDKFYGPIDRRTTSVRLTALGRAFRSDVEQRIRAGIDTDRPRGPANGTRDYLEAITPPGGLRGYRIP
jgi:DNA-binding MarR family transcriptional regulator